MRIENLELLKTYRNYNELCKALEIPNTRGDTKIANLKNLQRYCEFFIEGQKITIIEIYDKPLPLAARENSEIIRPLELLLLYYLSAQEDNKIKNTNNDWYEYIGLCSSQYNQTRKALKTKNKEVISKLPIVQNSSFLKNTSFKNWLFFLGEIINCANSKLYTIFNYSLKSMRNRGLITDYARPYILINKNGEHIKGEDIKSNVDMSELCLTCIREAVVEIGMSLQRIYSFPSKRLEYYKKINEKIFIKTNGEYKGFYQMTEILFTREGVNKLLEKINITVEKNKLQNTIYNKIIEQVKNNIGKFDNKKTFGIQVHKDSKKEKERDIQKQYMNNLLANVEDLTKGLIID